MMHGWGYGMRGFFGAGMIMMPIIWIAIIGLGVYFIKRVVDSSDRDRISHNSQASPLDIVKRRYAKGEIDKEEYQKIKDELERE